MKETHYKLKHRVTALFAAAVMLYSMLPGAAFAEEPTPQPTEETVQMEQQAEPSETDNGQTDASSPDLGAATEESAAPTTDEPAEENEPYTFDGEVLYQDMPDAPTGSYLGSYGLPVATGETKIGLGAWDADLEQDSYLSAEALDSDNLTLATPLLEDTDYAIVPILAQVEYPTDGSTVDLVLPDSVTLLDYYGEPAKDAESLLHSEYSETSAAVLGVYVQADADFTAQLVYTAPDGSCLTKTLQVTIDRNATAEYPFPDSEIATFAERPTPAVTSGKITKVAKVNGTWLIWFNGEPAYCCTHGANGQPAGCPTYTYVNTSTVNADQCIPGDHYGNQIRIWGGLNQLSLGDADDLPAVFSADEGEETSLLDFCESIYDDTIKVKISKVDITTNEELPGAELVIKDKDGTEIDRWISTNGPHYVEKMPAGDYTLTEITAPNGYKVAESIDFTVLPTGEMQTVVMKDAREDTPTPTPDNTPTPDHTPQPTPNTTPAPTPVPAAPTATPTPLLTIPKTGDNSSLGLLLAIAGISLAGLAVLVHKSARRKDIAPRDDDDEDTED